MGRILLAWITFESSRAMKMYRNVQQEERVHELQNKLWKASSDCDFHAIEKLEPEIRQINGGWNRFLMARDFETPYPYTNFDWVKQIPEVLDEDYHFEDLLKNPNMPLVDQLIIDQKELGKLNELLGTGLEVDEDFHISTQLKTFIKFDAMGEKQSVPKFSRIMKIGNASPITTQEKGIVNIDAFEEVAENGEKGEGFYKVDFKTPWGIFMDCVNSEIAQVIQDRSNRSEGSGRKIDAKKLQNACDAIVHRCSAENEQSLAEIFKEPESRARVVEVKMAKQIYDNAGETAMMKLLKVYRRQQLAASQKGSEAEARKIVDFFLGRYFHHDSKGLEAVKFANDAGNKKLARFLEFHIFTVHICQKNWSKVEEFIGKYNPNSRGDIVENAFYVEMVHDLVDPTVIYHDNMSPEERFVLFRQKSEWLLRLFLEFFKKGLLQKDENEWLRSYQKTIRNNQNTRQDDMSIIKFIAQQCNLFVSSQQFWRVMYFSAPAIFEMDSFKGIGKELWYSESMGAQRRTQVQLQKYRFFQFILAIHPLQYFLPEVFKQFHIVKLQTLEQFTNMAQFIQEILEVLKLQMDEHPELYSPHGQEILDFVDAIEKLNFAEQCWLLSESVLEIVDRWQVAQQSPGNTVQAFDLPGLIEKVKMMVISPNKMTPRETADAPVVQNAPKVAKSELLPQKEIELRCLDHVELLKEAVVKFIHSCKLDVPRKNRVAESKVVAESQPKSPSRSKTSSMLAWFGFGPTQTKDEPPETTLDEHDIHKSNPSTENEVVRVSILEIGGSGAQTAEINSIIMKGQLDLILNDGSEEQKSATCLHMFSVLHGIEKEKLAEIDWSEEGIKKLDPLKKYPCRECQLGHLRLFLEQFDALLLRPEYTFNSEAYDGISVMDALSSSERLECSERFERVTRFDPSEMKAIQECPICSADLSYGVWLDDWRRSLAIRGEDSGFSKSSSCSGSVEAKNIDCIQPTEGMTKIVEDKKDANETTNLPYYALRNFVWFLVAMAFSTRDWRYLFFCVPHVLFESYAVDVFEKLNFFLNCSNMFQTYSRKFHVLKDVFRFSGWWPSIALSYSLAFGMPGLLSLALLTAYHLFVVKMFNVSAPAFHRLFVLVIRVLVLFLLFQGTFSWHHTPAFLILHGSDFINIPKYHFKKAYYGGDEITNSGENVVAEHEDGFNSRMKSLIGLLCFFLFFSQLGPQAVVWAFFISFFVWVQLIACGQDFLEMRGISGIRELFRFINLEENVIWRFTTVIVLSLVFFEVDFFCIFTTLFFGIIASAINMNSYGKVPFFSQYEFYKGGPMMCLYVAAIVASIHRDVLILTFVCAVILLPTIWMLSGRNTYGHEKAHFGQGGILWGDHFTRGACTKARQLYGRLIHDAIHVLTRAAPARFSIFFLIAAFASEMSIGISKDLQGDNTATNFFRALFSFLLTFSAHSMCFLIPVNVISLIGLSCLPLLVQRPRKLQDHEYYLRGSKDQKGHVTKINGMEQADGSRAVDYYMQLKPGLNLYLKLAPATNVISFYDEMVYKLVEWDGNRHPKRLPELNPVYDVRTIVIAEPGVLANNEGVILSEGEYEEWVKKWMSPKENDPEKNTSPEDEEALEDEKTNQENEIEHLVQKKAEDEAQREKYLKKKREEKAIYEALRREVEEAKKKQ